MVARMLETKSTLSSEELNKALLIAHVSLAQLPESQRAALLACMMVGTWLKLSKEELQAHYEQATDLLLEKNLALASQPTMGTLVALIEGIQNAQEPLKRKEAQASA